MTDNQKRIRGLRSAAAVLAVMLSFCFLIAAGAAEADDDPYGECPINGTHVFSFYTNSEPGKHTARCVSCNLEIEEDCTYAEETKAPTQTAAGSVKHTCTKCGYFYNTVIPAERERVESSLMGDINGNSKLDAADARAILRAVVSLEPISNEKLPYADMTGDGAVTAADARLALRTAVNMEDPVRHQLTGAVIKEAKCSETGSMNYSCAYCGLTHSLTIPKRNHTYVLKRTEAATCQKEGATVYECSVCGAPKSVTIPKTEHTWVAATATAPKRCSVCGTMVTGWTKVGNDWYYFNKDGSLPKGEMLIYATVNKVTAHWYTNNGRLNLTYRGALEQDGKYWIIENGKGNAAETASELTLYRAFLAVADATTPDMTMAEKLAACYTYCQNAYQESRPRTPNYTGVDWPVIYANDMFVDGTGNCCSYAAAFAYMAKAIGYENVYACNSGGHGWAEVEGLIYDVEWAIHYHTYNYYGITYDTVTDVNYKGALDKSVDWMYVKL